MGMTGKPTKQQIVERGLYHVIWYTGGGRGQ